MSNPLLSCGGVLRVVILRTPSHGAQRASVLARFVGWGGPCQGSGAGWSAFRGRCGILLPRQNPCVGAERVKAARGRGAGNPGVTHARPKSDKSPMSPERPLLSGPRRSRIRCDRCHGIMHSGSCPAWMPRVGPWAPSTAGRRRARGARVVGRSVGRTRSPGPLGPVTTARVGPVGHPRGPRDPGTPEIAPHSVPDHGEGQDRGSRARTRR